MIKNTFIVTTKWSDTRESLYHLPVHQDTGSVTVVGLECVAVRCLVYKSLSMQGSHAWSSLLGL